MGDEESSQSGRYRPSLHWPARLCLQWPKKPGSTILLQGTGGLGVSVCEWERRIGCFLPLSSRLARRQFFFS